MKVAQRFALALGLIGAGGPGCAGGSSANNEVSPESADARTSTDSPSEPSADAFTGTAEAGVGTGDTTVGSTSGDDSAAPSDANSGSGNDADSTLSSNEVVGVSGTHMTLNGVSWLSRGVVLRGLVAPSAFLQSTYPQIYTALLNYGVPELDAAHSFGADTLRFQVSQPSLDPESPLYGRTGPWS